jgi:hypothetical protein
MQQYESSHHNDPLDLLRRFVPTPLKAVYRISSLRVIVKTNDITLLPAFPLGADLDAVGESVLEWKLVRDADSPGLLGEPVFLTSNALTVVEMGTACLLALDHERRELLGFIGADVDAHTYQEFLVPFLCRMTNEAFIEHRFQDLFGDEDAND